MVLPVVSWGRFRIPVALGLIDRQSRGHQNILFRQMLRDCAPQRGGSRSWWSLMPALRPMLPYA